MDMFTLFDVFNERKIAQLLIAHGVDQNIKTKQSNVARALLHGIKDECYDWLVSNVA